jgi:hypothetical protein
MDRPQGTELLTIGDIARETNEAAHRVKYAIDRNRIEEVQRAGIIRLFSRDQLELIRSVMRRTAQGAR